MDRYDNKYIGLKVEVHNYHGESNKGTGTVVEVWEAGYGNVFRVKLDTGRGHANCWAPETSRAECRYIDDSFSYLPFL